MPFILALDEGTTSARAALYDDQGRRIAMESCPVECIYPQPGWVEQDANEIWKAQLGAAQRTLSVAGIQASEIAAIGITNQRETTVVWDRHTGQPVANAIVWQCRRTAAYCEALQPRELIERKTGLIVDAYFSASKIRWQLDYAVEDHPDDLLFGNVDTWLIWKLTNGKVHVTDPTNASRTMLMNLETGDWDDELLEIFGLPRSMMPRIAPSSGVTGVTAMEHLGAEIPIAGIAGDQQAALFGQACFVPGCPRTRMAPDVSRCCIRERTGRCRRIGCWRRARRLRIRMIRRSSRWKAVCSWRARRYSGCATRCAWFRRLRRRRRWRRRCPIPAGLISFPRLSDSARRIGIQTRGEFYAASRRARMRLGWCARRLKASRYQTRDLVQAMESDSGQKLERSSRRRRCGEQFSDAVSGRYSGLPDRASGGY